MLRFVSINCYKIGDFCNNSDNSLIYQKLLVTHLLTDYFTNLFDNNCNALPR